MDYTEISRHCKCCACGGQLAGFPVAVQIPVTITWESPKWGNFLSGVENQGVAFICDACAETEGFQYTAIKNVVQFFSANGVKYHPITWVSGPNNRLVAQLT